MGRFINADDVLDSWIIADGVLSSNVYCYCNGNPVNHIDETGYSFKSTLLNIIKSLRWRAIKLLGEATKLLAKILTGKIPCAGLAMIIDGVLGLLIPAVPTAVSKVMKVLLGYKSISKDMATVALRGIQKSIAKALAAFGISVGLNLVFSTIINTLMEFNISRFLSIGGIICFLLDWADGKIDMWIDFPKIGRRIAGFFK